MYFFNAACPGFVRAFYGCLAVCLAALPAIAADKYEIKADVKPGKVWRFDNSMSTEMNMKTTANGQDTTQKQGASQHREGVMTVHEVKNGIPSSITVVFGKNCGDTQIANGQSQQVPWPLAGRTVRLSRSADGTIEHDLKKDDNPAAVSEVLQMMEFDRSMMPRGAVSVGEEWVPDTNRMKQKLQLDANDKVDMKCKLGGLGAANRLKTYDIVITGDVAKVADGVTCTMNLGGVMQVDMLTGVQTSSTLIGKMSIKGQGQGQGPKGEPMNIAMDGSGVVEVEQSYIPEDGAAPAVEPRIGENPPGMPGRNPLADPPPGRGNPLARGNAGSPFSGMFKGTELSADLKVDGDKVSGTILLGQKSFPVTGSIKEGKLVGAFEAGGTKFNFVAMLEGDNMMLDSDGTKYTLKKEGGAAAPGPGPGRPRNPLEQ